MPWFVARPAHAAGLRATSYGPRTTADTSVALEIMNLIALVPLLPAAGAAINGVIGIGRFSRPVAAGVACASMFAAFGLSVAAFVRLLALPAELRVQDVVVAQWIPRMPLETSGGMGSFAVDWSFRLDPLSALMILVVTGIGLLIHIYSIAYMQDEPRGAYARFFCYLNLFCAFMLVLVLHVGD